ncbi:DoxX family protein [Pseudoxanthomonas sp. PXM01]|uniref:DoxX family protein n=1 Tax=Pseudoxanthomonas sp. PXM01 TaxID=2769295 RepID=UPI00177BDD54|nr:DoxX family protein [Pseudoxanthomonas sp. PXM01]MBD9469648.1 DoxX family protein [Pseudoxanthomonas sp. PXM01]
MQASQPGQPIGDEGTTSRWETLALLCLRVLVGSFLVWGVTDNIIFPAKMDIFEAFLETHGFPWPGLSARVSVWAQFLCGLSFLSGVGFRLAGAVCALNFTVAVVMVDYKFGIRGAFPAALLAVTGLYFSARGPGRAALRLRRVWAGSRK